MPLFACSECTVIENTATSLYWETIGGKSKPLCSQCDPKLKRWHGRFPRTPYAEFIVKYPNEDVRNAPDGATINPK